MRHTDANRNPNIHLQHRYSGHERRTAQRIETPFPTTVRSIDVLLLSNVLGGSLLWGASTNGNRVETRDEKPA